MSESFEDIIAGQFEEHIKWDQQGWYKEFKYINPGSQLAKEMLAVRECGQQHGALALAAYDSYQDSSGFKREHDKQLLQEEKLTAIWGMQRRIKETMYPKGNREPMPFDAAVDEASELVRGRILEDEIRDGIWGAQGATELVDFVHKATKLLKQEPHYF